MKNKRKRLLTVPRSSDPSENEREQRGQVPLVMLAGHRIWLPSRSPEARIGEPLLVLPRVFEWTCVPGPDGIQ